MTEQDFINSSLENYEHYNSTIAVGIDKKVCVLDYGSFPQSKFDNSLSEIIEEGYIDNVNDLLKNSGVYTIEFDYWEWSDGYEYQEGDSGGELISFKKLSKN